MFPTLLEMEALQTNAELKRLFNHNLVDIPDWMFLSWIPQILSVLPFESASFVDELVLRIAKTYPLAIAYPFRLSYEHFQQNLAPNSPDPRPFVSRLIGLLQNPTTDTFVRAMQCLCVPEKKLAHHLLELFHELGTITEAEVFKRRLRYTIQCVWPVRHDSLNGRSFERIAMYRSKIENLEDVDGNFGWLNSFASSIRNFHFVRSLFCHRKNHPRNSRLARHVCSTKGAQKRFAAHAQPMAAAIPVVRPRLVASRDAGPVHRRPTSRSDTASAHRQVQRIR